MKCLVNSGRIFFVSSKLPSPEVETNIAPESHDICKTIRLPFAIWPIFRGELLNFRGVVKLYMGVSKNSGTPKWMVYITENPIKTDDLGGKPLIFGNTHIPFFNYQ